MSTILRLVKDGSSTTVYSRRIAEESFGVYAQAGIVYSVAVPSGVHVAVVAAGASVMVAHSAYVSPLLAGDLIPAGVALNPSSLWVSDQSMIYFSTVAEALINIEFYQILGGVDY